MAESLLAVLLVTSSAKGSNLVFHWPPYPSCQPRLARPKPQHDEKSSLLDNVWIAATNHDLKSADTSNAKQHTSIYDDPELDEWDYEWKRPNAYRERARSLSFAESNARSRPGSRRASPSMKDPKLFEKDDRGRKRSSLIEEEYENLLGFPAEFLANILCPKDDMCHQKFELVVDDLAFIGHPVCAESDGGWRFKEPRGRGKRDGSRVPNSSKPSSPKREQSTSEEAPTPSSSTPSPSHTFHLVFVIDLPDPSSSSSGNVFKYFHVMYEQLAFTVTAVLFQEQVLNRFVDTECEILNTLREGAFSRGDSFTEYVGRALDGSSLARALKTLYDAVKGNTIARLVINEVGVEVQLPPQLDHLLHAEEENPDFVEHLDPDAVSWGPELSFGWGLPSLAPWKSLLLYDMDEDQNDLKMNLSRPGLSQEDQMLAEGLIQFLETVSIFDSLAVVAHSLDWDLERQVYPTVRWLVYHRRAKIVDTVNSGLRTVFALSSKMERSLPELAAEFDKAFPNPVIPPLSKLFASISNPSSSSSSSPFSPSSHTRTASHAIESLPASGAASSSTSLDFFACAVRSKDLIPVYQDVVVWLLRRELLVTLHLHIRIVATAAIKANVRRRRARATKRRLENTRRGSEQRRGLVGQSAIERQYFNDGLANGSFVARNRTRRLSSRSAGSGIIEGGITQSFKQHDGFMNRGRSTLRRVDAESSNGDYGSHSRLRYSALADDDDDEEDLSQENFEDDVDDGTAADDDDDGPDYEGDDDQTDDDHLPSIIPEPGQATPLQRKWIEAMSEGKGEDVARRFRLINQFFDGKRTDDEILYTAEINRRQLREVLQQYDEFLLTSLHPA